MLIPARTKQGVFIAINIDSIVDLIRLSDGEYKVSLTNGDYYNLILTDYIVAHIIEKDVNLKSLNLIDYILDSKDAEIEVPDVSETEESEEEELLDE